MPVNITSAGVFVFTTGLFFSVIAPAVTADLNDASHFVEFYQVGDEDCEDKGGARVFVKNLHKTQIIDLQLDRYFYDVRQAGRSMFPLKPESSQALGCSRVFDAEQRWELISAMFITESVVKERYGDYE